MADRRRAPATRAGRKTRTHAPRHAAETAPDLDRLIHEPMRLGIMCVLAVNETLSFNDLKRLLKATDGNLSVHARKLEEAQYVICEKSFVSRMPRSDYHLTALGRQALAQYLDHMEGLIRTAREP